MKEEFFGWRAWVVALMLPVLGACGLLSTWHWEHVGPEAADYAVDETQCKARSYSGADGAVTRENVRRMHACMEAKGWRKVPN